MRLLSIVLSFMFAARVPAIAQVPHLLNYQGRVTVDNVNFHGEGQFKFALVNQAGDESFWSNDGTSTAGSEPAASVTRAVSRGLYQVQLGDTSLPNMEALPPSVFQRDNVWLRVWFNDGTNGFEQLSPDSRIAAVAYAMMADGVRPGGVTSGMIAPGAVNGAHIEPGSITAANIAPGLLGGGGGGGAPSGSITFSADPNSASLAAAGYARISKTDLAVETWSLASQGEFALGSANAVWTGSEMLVWQNGWSFVMRYDPATDQWIQGSSIGAPVAGVSANQRRIAWTGSELYVIGPGSFARYHPGNDTWLTLDNTNLPAGGDAYFVTWTGDRLLAVGNGAGGLYDPVSDAWQPISMAGAPAASFFREGARVWTGTELVVWGNASTGTGARYHPGNDVWTPMSPSVLSGRIYPHCCWTGTHVLIYGGNSNGPNDGGGALYDPATDTWASMNTTGQPWTGGLRTTTTTCATVWTGTEMIVWGGSDGMTGVLADGGRYDPSTNTWSPIPVAAGVSGRIGHLAIWTGTEMVVAGGNVPSHARYAPATGNWIADRPSSFAPANRSGHTGVWTGNEMIVWGGAGSGGNLATGGRFHPQTKERRPLAMSGAPSPRSGHSSAWSGSEMIIWGGANAGNYQSDGARYQPGADIWIAMSNTDAPTPRKDHSAIWTGTEYIVWGGADGGGALATGAKYSPASDAWVPVSNVDAPSARRFHGAVWTGQEMIVWGGLDGSLSPIGTGARYVPSTDTWTPVSMLGAPAARYVHTAIWTGTEMIVWGGNAPGATNTGARYSPQSDTWTPLPTTNAPSARSGHSAIWTGTEWIVWGGANGGTILNTGARFIPHLNIWESLATASAPAARTGHIAVWAQGSMLVFGGTGGGFAPLGDVSEYTPPQTIYVYQHP